MKKYFILAIFIVSSFSYGQMLRYGASYTANDTSIWFALGNGNASLGFIARDSCNVSLDLDYAPSIKDTTRFGTYRVIDSTNSVVGAGMFKGYLIRGGSTNNIPAAGAVRLRVTKIVGNGKNGTTTATYDAYIKQY